MYVRACEEETYSMVDSEGEEEILIRLSVRERKGERERKETDGG